MLLRLKVVPGSQNKKVLLDRDDKGYYLKVWLKNRAEKGKANKELFKLLKKLFGDFKLVSGATSREKLIKIKDLDISEKLKNLENLS